MLASTLSIPTLETRACGARLVLDDLEDLLELLHLVVLGKDLRRIAGKVRFGFRVGAMARA